MRGRSEDKLPLTPRSHEMQHLQAYRHQSLFLADLDPDCFARFVKSQTIARHNVPWCCYSSQSALQHPVLILVDRQARLTLPTCALVSDAHVAQKPCEGSVHHGTEGTVLIPVHVVLSTFVLSATRIIKASTARMHRRAQITIASGGLQILRLRKDNSY